MKTIYKIYSLFLLTSFLLFVCSCIEELDYSMHLDQSEIVVNCFIKNSRDASLFMGNSISVFNTGKTSIQSSVLPEIKLNEEIVASFILDDTIYKANYNFETGKEYSFRLIIDNKEIQASTVIPRTPDLISAKITCGEYSDEEGSPVTKTYITFQDQKNEENFYEVLIFRVKSHIDSKPLFNEPINFWQYYNLNDPVLLSENLLQYEPSTFVFSDNLFNDFEYTLNLTYKGGYSLGEIDGGGYSPDEVVLVFRHISEEYYKFLKSWYKHRYNQNVDRNVSTHFDAEKLIERGEPSELYTNIEGGIGIFAAYSEVIVPFEHDLTLQNNK